MIKETERDAYRRLPLVREVAYEIDPELSLEVATQWGHIDGLWYTASQGKTRIRPAFIFLDLPAKDSQQLKESVRAQLQRYLLGVKSVA